MNRFCTERKPCRLLPSGSDLTPFRWMIRPAPGNCHDGTRDAAPGPVRRIAARASLGVASPRTTITLTLNHVLSPMPFETVLAQAQAAGYETPLLAVALGRSKLPQSLDAFDKGTGGALARVLSSGDFVGKKDEVAVLYPTGSAARVLLVGLGKADEIDRTTIRRAAAIAAKRARSLGVPRAAFHLPAEFRGKVAAEEVAQPIAEGLAQGAWQYTEMKRGDEDSKKSQLERVDILLPDSSSATGDGQRRGAAIGAGQTFARGIQVLPGNICTPSYLGNVARDLAQRHGFEITVLDKAAIVREKMGA